MLSRSRENPHTPAPDTGWDDLAEGRWEAALEQFERATRSELEGATLVACARVDEGMRRLEIAERLNVSERTVHRHVANPLRKLGLPSRTAAAARAVRHGLLGPPAG